MWTLKSIEATAEQNTTAFTATITYTNGTDDVTLASTRLSSRKELEDTVRVNQARLNERDEVLKEVTDGTFTLPETEAPREPSEVEKKKAIFDQELAEYKEMVELSQTLDNLIDSNDLTNKENAVRNARTEYENARRNA